MLLICESAKRAKTLWEDMSQLVKNTESVYFPALELIPFEVLGQSGELEQPKTQRLGQAFNPKRAINRHHNYRGIRQSITAAKNHAQGYPPPRSSARVV